MIQESLARDPQRQVGAVVISTGGLNVEPGARAAAGRAAIAPKLYSRTHEVVAARLGEYRRCASPPPPVDAHAPTVLVSSTRCRRRR